jgi:hypothetical protein
MTFLSFSSILLWDLLHNNAAAATDDSTGSGSETDHSAVKGVLGGTHLDMSQLRSPQSKQRYQVYFTLLICFAIL